MIEFQCGVPEERWIDFHLGRLPKETSDALIRHAEGCSSCRLVCRRWGKWLAEEAGEEAGSGELLPSKAVWRSLRRKVWRRWLRRGLRTRHAWIVAAAAAVLLLVLAGLRQQMSAPEAGQAVAMQPKAYAELHEPDGAVLMERPDTVVYTAGLGSSASPVSNGRPNVTVWVNGNTAEFFVLIDGLLPEGNRDVQAWGALKEGMTSLGLLEFHYTQGHLYARLQQLPDVEKMSFTIEPKGGSRRPTSPQSAEVVLASGK